jgi:hypothetical protein
LQPEVMVVVAYGLILPAAVLAVPPLGCINIHASLLPRWRGAAPIQRAILAGDTETGVCLMQMETGLDTGPVLACTKTPIAPDDTGSRLHDRLARLGGQLLADNLAAIEQQQLIPRVQDEALARPGWTGLPMLLNLRARCVPSMPGRWPRQPWVASSCVSGRRKRSPATTQGCRPGRSRLPVAPASMWHVAPDACACTGYSCQVHAPCLPLISSMPMLSRVCVLVWNDWQRADTA